MMRSIVQAGKHAIIIGGSGGIGSAIAILLLQRGMHITLIARNEKKLGKVAAAVTTNAGCSSDQIQWVSADVTSPTLLESAVQEASVKFGTADLLIVTSGVVEPGFFNDTSLDIFSETMATNYMGVIHAIKACLPAMIQKEDGHIVVVSSAAGLMGVVGYTSYSPSKFAILGLAESLRYEIESFGIRISVVFPPDTNTPQLDYENERKPEQTKLMTGTVKPWQADNLAKVIVRGIDRSKFRITPGWQVSLLSRVYSLFYPLFYSAFSRKIKQ